MIRVRAARPEDADGFYRLDRGLFPPPGAPEVFLHAWLPAREAMQDVLEGPAAHAAELGFSRLLTSVEEGDGPLFSRVPVVRGEASMLLGAPLRSS